MDGASSLCGGNIGKIGKSQVTLEAFQWQYDNAAVQDRVEKQTNGSRKQVK